MENIDEKTIRTNLVVDEVYNYIQHLGLIAGITGQTVGDATKYSVFTFGSAVKANYALDAEGNITVDADFSTEASRYPGETKTFDRRINPDLADFNEVRRVLMEKYGVEFGLSYEDEQYTIAETNGSGDMISTVDKTHYNIKSHMAIRGRLLNQELESTAVLK